MMKTILAFILFLNLYTACLAQNQTYSDTFTITTYYPAPHGVYGTMRLYPGQLPSEGVAPGVLYYNETEDMLKFHNNTTWVNVTGGGGGGYWTQQSGTGNIHATNSSGNVGIGTANPTEKLVVAGNTTVNGNLNAAGMVVVGTTALSSAPAGALRWNGTQIQYSNGAQWLALGGGQAPGTVVMFSGENPTCPSNTVPSTYYWPASSGTPCSTMVCWHAPLRYCTGLACTTPEGWFVSAPSCNTRCYCSEWVNPGIGIYTTTRWTQVQCVYK